MKPFYQKIKNTHRMIYYTVLLVISLFIDLLNGDGFHMTNYWFIFFTWDGMMFFMLAQKEENDPLTKDDQSVILNSKEIKK